MTRRILMTADAVGGVWTYALDLIRALPDVEFALATMGRELSDDQEVELEALGNVRMYPSTFRLEWMDDPWEDIARAGGWLLGLEKLFRPDVVHLNGLVHGALPFKAPKMVVVHSCVLSWWQAVKGEPAPPSWNRYADEVGRSLRAADLVAAPSRAMLAEADRLYGPFHHAAAIPNGRATGPSAPKEPIVFAAGRMWDEGKNVAALSAVDCAWPIHVAGDGSLMGRLSAAETRRWMARAAIYALPARYEPFGLSILEAAFAGCALVLGDIPSLRENWDGAAVFVAPDDAAGLESALDRLIANPDLRERLGNAAVSRAQELNAERFGQAYRDLYESLQEGHPSSFFRGSQPSNIVNEEREKNEEGPGVELRKALR